MKKADFLDILRERLSGLPPNEIEDVIADYTAHFAEGEAADRTEEEIAAALGDPLRLARELRAEAGFRRWEVQRTPANFKAALLGFVALVAMDLILLLPVLIGLIFFTLIASLVAIALCIGGLMAVVSQLGTGFFSLKTLDDILTGFALLGFGIGGGALLIWMSDAVVRLLAKYARVHYKLLNRSGLAA